MPTSIAPCRSAAVRPRAAAKSPKPPRTWRMGRRGRGRSGPPPPQNPPAGPPRRPGWSRSERLMLLGRVVGTLVATRKEPSLEGLKFLVLRQLDIEGKAMAGYRVAADAGGAGPGG